MRIRSMSWIAALAALTRSAHAALGAAATQIQAAMAMHSKHLLNIKGFTDARVRDHDHDMSLIGRRQRVVVGY